MKRLLKRLTLGIIIATMLTGNLASATPVGVKKDINVVTNSVYLWVGEISIDTDNILYNGTTYAPLRAVAEALNKDVLWNGETKIIRINDKVGPIVEKEFEWADERPVENKKISVVFNGVSLWVGNKAITADNFVYNGTTYVPLRAVAEALDKDVLWYADQRLVCIEDKVELLSEKEVLAAVKDELFGSGANFPLTTDPMGKVAYEVDQDTYLSIDHYIKDERAYSIRYYSIVIDGDSAHTVTYEWYEADAESGHLQGYSTFD